MTGKTKTKTKTKSKSRAGKPFKEFDFKSKSSPLSYEEALRAWLDTLPREEADVDPRLKRRIPVELNLHQLTIEGFDYLAKKQGMKSGKQLMYMVLSQYLSNNLPEDF
jgi:hypothetical protein